MSYETQRDARQTGSGQDHRLLIVGTVTGLAGSDPQPTLAKTSGQGTGDMATGNKKTLAGAPSCPLETEITP